MGTIWLPLYRVVAVLLSVTLCHCVCSEFNAKRGLFVCAVACCQAAAPSHLRLGSNNKLPRALSAARGFPSAILRLNTHLL